MRPSFHEIYMEFAVNMSRRSTCQRPIGGWPPDEQHRGVGCAIVTADWRSVVAVGYNGGASGLENACDRTGAAAVGNCGCLHAEENAAINCTVPRDVEKIVFCTHLPCVMCAKRLINLGGVQEIYYRHDYRVKEALRWFERARITTGHLVEGSSAADAQLRARVALHLHTAGTVLGSSPPEGGSQ